MRDATHEIVPARLHAILARKARTGVVIRRGPSRHVAVLGWDLDTDRLRLGQWLKGRIYERRCDLSPDGTHFIYFAMNGRWSSPMKGSWSAISLAPYLKALCLWSTGDCWNGGGLFVSNKSYWLNGSRTHERVAHNSGLVESAEFPWSESYGGECPGVYYIRLQRDGWKLVEYRRHEKYEGTAVFDKRVSPAWTLRKLANETLERRTGRGCYFDTHELRNSRSGEIIELEDWEWADVDGPRILWAERGTLNSGRVVPGGLRDRTTIADLNGMTFEPVAAPY